VKLEISIDTDHPSFGPDPTGELRYILRDIINHLDVEPVPGSRQLLTDLEGRPVGVLTYSR
jgi:hypothetical protein